MNIIVSLNQRYYRYTYVMLTSVFKNHSKGRVSIYILHNDLSETATSGLRDLTYSYDNQITFLHIRKELFSNKLPITSMWTLEAYFRLLIVDLLPEDVERILYLDVDIIVNKNLSELYNMDFEGSCFIACRDMGVNGIFADSDIRAPLFNRQIEEGYPYFNSGVMLWNLVALRGNYSLSYYMELAKKLEYRFLAVDQDLLNYAHYNQVKLVDEYKYNLWGYVAYNCDVHYEQVKEEAFIIHYPGEKPWNGEYIHNDIEQLWWDYARLTPYYHELLEEFVEAAISLPNIYNTFKALDDEKRALAGELHTMQELCKKLSALLR